MYWQYNPYILLPGVAAAISIALVTYMWQYRAKPMVKAFLFLMLAVAVWALATVMELGSVDLTYQVFWSKTRYFGIVTVPLAWMVFTLIYTGREKWLTRRNLSLLAVIPLVTLAIVWTNDIHHLVWRDIWMDTSGPFPMAAVVHGIWFWVHTSFSYSLLLLGTFWLIEAFIRSPRLYRKQIGTLLIGALIPWVANILFIAGFSSSPHLDLTPLMFSVSALVIAWSISSSQLLDIVPVAHDAVIKGMRDGMVVLDIQNRIVDINPAAQQIIGHTDSKIIGQKITSVLPTQCGLVEPYCGADEVEADSEIVLGEGEAQRYYDLRVSPLYDRLGPKGHLFLLYDITERKFNEEHLAYNATHDPLTKLPNRALLGDRLSLAVTQAHRNQEKLALMVLDLDNFKEVNDHLGHDFGDRILKEASQRLTKLLRSGDTVARLGGDEFVILLPQIQREGDAADVARRILYTFRRPFLVDGYELRVTASVGIAIYLGTQDGTSLIKQADNAMYEAKKLGRNKYQFYAMHAPECVSSVQLALFSSGESD